MKLPEVFISFKNYLGVNNVSKVTQKNYASDLNHFWAWFIFHLKSLGYQTTDELNELILRKITADTLEAYKSYLVNSRTPQSTINRRFSSLRKFSEFCLSQKLIEKDFALSLNNLPKKLSGQKADLANFEQITDKFAKKLVAEKNSRLTVKNYLTDVKNFLFWLNRITDDPTKNVLEKVTPAILAEYQDRLLKVAKLSPRSINRKLSSLRKFFAFALKHGYLAKNPFERQTIKTSKSWLRLGLFKLFRQPEFSLGIPKKTFAPGDLSQKGWGRPQKLLFKLRYSRPKWYSAYNESPFANYFHWAILIIFCAGIGFGLYQQVFTQPEINPKLAIAPAGPPLMLSFQGRLTNPSGDPITEASWFNFAIYNSFTASGSARLWSETKSITPDIDGIFNTMLGDTTPINQTIFKDNTNLWLGVTLESNPEMTDRIQIATVGYAFNSKYLDGYPAASLGSSDPTATAGAEINTIPVINAYGNLIIAAVSPTLQSTSGNFTIKGQTITLQSSIGLGGVNISTGNTMEIKSASGAATLRLDQTGTGDIFAASASGVNKFVIKNDGKVGIGTVNPSAKLDIVGDLEVNGYATVSSSLALGTASAPAGPGNLALSGVITQGLWNGTAIGVLYGGMGGDVTPAGAGEILYSTGTTAYDSLVAGAAGQVLQSNGAGAPAWADVSGLGTGWTFANQGVYPTNTSLNLYIGGTATASAKFMADGLTGDGYFAGDLTLDGDLRLNNNQILNSDGTATIMLNLTPGASVPAKNILNAGNWMVQNTAGPQITKAALIVDQWITEDIFTASASGVPKFVVDYDGSVGIGTANPGAKLDIDGNIRFTEGATRYLTIQDRTVNGIGDHLYIQAGGGGAGFVPVRGGNVYIDGGTTNNPGWEGNVLLASQRGNVGIGTSNPSYKLDVVGTASISGQLNMAGSIIPYTTGQFDLGSSANHWANLYADNVYGGTSGIQGFWQRTDGSLAPTNITDSLNLGATATASALVHLAGTAGENSWINTGNVGIGTTSFISTATSLQVTRNTSNDLFLTSHADDTTNPVFYGAKSRGTAGSPTVVQSGDFVAGYLGKGYDGSNYVNAGGIRIAIDETPGTNDMPGRITFHTSLDGTVNLAERMRIDNAGNVGIGTTAPIASLDVGTGGTGIIMPLNIGFTDATATQTIINTLPYYPSLVANSSFELDSDADNTPDAWYNSLATNGSVGMSTSTYNHGAKSATVTCTNTTCATYWRSNCFAVSPSTTYTSTIRAIESGDSDNSSVGFLFRIFWHTENTCTTAASTANNEITGTLKNTVTNAWATFTGSPATPANAYFARIVTGQYNPDEANVTYYLDRLTVQSGANSADLAEIMFSSSTLEPGDIVTGDNGTIVGKGTTDSQSILGIVSASPGVILKNENENYDLPQYPIALQGRVPVKVTTANGPIRTGDSIAVSLLPGVGAKAIKAGPIIGKALESYDNPDPQTVGKIMTFVNLSWYDPQVFLTSVGDLEIIKTDGVYSGLLGGAKINADSNADLRGYKLVDSLGQAVNRIGAFGEIITAKIKAGAAYIGNLQTDLLISNKIVSPLIEADQINADALTVKDSFISPLVESDQITTKSLFAQLIDADTAHVASLSAESVYTEDLDARSVTTSSLVSDHVKAQALDVAGEIRAKKIFADEIVGTTLSANYITNIYNYTSEVPPEENHLEGEVAPAAHLPGETNSGETNIDEILAQIEAQGLNLGLYVDIATLSAQLAFIQGDLKVLGRSSLAETSVAGVFTQDATFVISEGRQIDVLGDNLYLQKMGLGGVDIADGKVVIDKNGNVQIAGDLAVAGEISASRLVIKRSDLPGGPTSSEEVASIDASGSATAKEFKIIRDVQADNTPEEIIANSSAGTGRITAGHEIVMVKTPFARENSLIYLTPVGPTEGKVLFLAKIEPDVGFTVSIDNFVSADINFNWWIVN